MKRPVKGIAKIPEAKSEYASIKYQGYLTAAVEQWKEYRNQLTPLKRKPVLFIMMNSTAEADDVAEWIAKAYPAEFGGGKTQIIHTDKTGDVSKKDLEAARKAVQGVNDPQNPINAIVSVLMLREGWDVQNVTVVVGLRPYTSKANILPEQAIGRGLRLMFRDLNADYTEHVDVIGNQKFLEFVDDLEKLEELKLETFELGKDKLRILTIMPLEERKEFDIGLPLLTPVLVRKKSLADEIASLNVMAFQTMLLPLTAHDPNNKTFRYEGHDIITLQKIVERDYKVPEPQTAQELIGYYARRIAEAVKLPSQFSVLAPKVREFFEEKAFGRWVDLNESVTVRAMATPVASYVCTEEFKRVLKGMSIAEQEPELLGPPRMLSTCQPFPWSRKVYEGTKFVFNMVPCENEFEKEFTRFLDSADDVRAFAKLPAIRILDRLHRWRDESAGLLSRLRGGGQRRYSLADRDQRHGGDRRCPQGQRGTKLVRKRDDVDRNPLEVPQDSTKSIRDPAAFGIGSPARACTRDTHGASLKPGYPQSPAVFTYSASIYSGGSPPAPEKS